jgi:hypothetical protein
MLKRCGNGGGASRLPSSSPWKQKVYSHMDKNFHITTHCSRFTLIKISKVLTSLGRSFRLSVKIKGKGNVIVIWTWTAPRPWNQHRRPECGTSLFLELHVWLSVFQKRVRNVNCLEKLVSRLNFIIKYSLPICCQTWYLRISILILLSNFIPKQFSISNSV